MGGFFNTARAMLKRWRCPPLNLPRRPDTGVVSFFGLHDELVGIGDPGSPFDLFPSGRFDAEGDVIKDSIVKEDRVLVHVPHEFT